MPRKTGEIRRTCNYKHRTQRHLGAEVPTLISLCILRAEQQCSAAIYNTVLTTIGEDVYAHQLEFKTLEA